MFMKIDAECGGTIDWVGMGKVEGGDSKGCGMGKGAGEVMEISIKCGHPS